MKMLLVHCDHFSYLTTKRTKLAEEIPNGCKSCAIKDALVIFVTVEKYDAKNPSKVVAKSIEEITARAKQLGAKNLVLFPFVHLSEQVSDSEAAMGITEKLYEGLKRTDYSVDKAPFGWEKVFSLTSKGHPLAESSITIRP
ncbi:MAG: threonyl-tRNA synthetase editing domain-containing protein [Methanobacteriota archaeon]